MNEENNVRWLRRIPPQRTGEHVMDQGMRAEFMDLLSTAGRQGGDLGASIDQMIEFITTDRLISNGGDSGALTADEAERLKVNLLRIKILLDSSQQNVRRMLGIMSPNHPTNYKADGR